MANSRTRMPDRLAKKKWPNSWKTTITQKISKKSNNSFHLDTTTLKKVLVSA